MLAVAVIRGLRDDTRRHEVSFAIRGKKTIFTTVINLIKAAFRCVGDSDPLKVGDNHPWITDTSPYYAMPAPPTPITSTASTITAQSPTSTDGLWHGHGREQ